MNHVNLWTQMEKCKISHQKYGFVLNLEKFW